MTLPPLPLHRDNEGRDVLFVDNSGFMEGCSSCYRYLQYKCLNLRIPSAEKPALNFGGIMHSGEEFRYLHYGNRAVNGEFINRITPIFTQFFVEHPPRSDDWRDLNWALETMRRYNENYVDENFELLHWPEPIPCPHCEGGGVLNGEPCPWCDCSGSRKTMVELTFSLPFHVLIHKGYPLYVYYTGRIDLPLMLDSAIWVMDHKHVGQIGQSFWDEQRMTAQHPGYVWSFQQLTGLPVKGYIVNAVRTKQPPQYVQAAKGMDDIIATPTRGKYKQQSAWWKESFQRERFPCPAWKIEEWRNNTINLLEEFIWHYSRGYMPMKTKWCSQYSRCPYFDVCTLAPEDRGAMLQSGQFTENSWTPMKAPTQSMQ